MALCRRMAARYGIHERQVQRDYCQVRDEHREMLSQQDIESQRQDMLARVLDIRRRAAADAEELKRQDSPPSG